MRNQIYAAVAKTTGLVGVIAIIAAFWLGSSYFLSGLALFLISGLMKNDYQMMPIVNQYSYRLAALENENHRLKKAIADLAAGRPISIDLD